MPFSKRQIELPNPFSLTKPPQATAVGLSASTDSDCNSIEVGHAGQAFTSHVWTTTAGLHALVEAINALHPVPISEATVRRVLTAASLADLLDPPTTESMDVLIAAVTADLNTPPPTEAAAIVKQARDLGGMDPDDGLDAALDTLWIHGVADEQVGTVDEPGGHLFRVDRWTRRTDEQGNKTTFEWDSEAAAIQAMADHARMGQIA